MRSATNGYNNSYDDLMARTISQRELRNDSGGVLRAAQAGETFVITRNGTPVAELRGFPPRRFVPREEIARAARTAPRIDLDDFRADVDRVVDPYLGDG